MKILKIAGIVLGGLVVLGIVAGDSDSDNPETKTVTPETTTTTTATTTTTEDHVTDTTVSPQLLVSLMPAEKIEEFCNAVYNVREYGMDPEIGYDSFVEGYGSPPNGPSPRAVWNALLNRCM